MLVKGLRRSLIDFYVHILFNIKCTKACFELLVLFVFITVKQATKDMLKVMFRKLHKVTSEQEVKTLLGL